MTKHLLWGTYFFSKNYKLNNPFNGTEGLLCSYLTNKQRDKPGLAFRILAANNRKQSESKKDQVSLENDNRPIVAWNIWYWQLNILYLAH